jgi:hypothetical protein
LLSNPKERGCVRPAARLCYERCAQKAHLCVDRSFPKGDSR